MNPNSIILINLMNMRTNRDLGQYELLLYRQLLTTARAKARLDELMF